MSCMSRLIWVKFQKIGFHRYACAPDEVSYLKNLHRHLFKFKVGIEVFTNDRDIEFHMFQNFLETQYVSYLDLDNKSCELIAEDLIRVIISTYHGRNISVEVSEDDECGSIVEYHK